MYGYSARTALDKNPALAAYLGQTSARDGGMPQTAAPQSNQSDPFALPQLPTASPRSTGTPSLPALEGDPYQSMLVAHAQMQARKPFQRYAGLSQYLAR